MLRYAPQILRIRPRGWSVPATGRAGGSLWNKPIAPRGEAAELRLLSGQRSLPWNYPVIDDFADNIATSIKSMDLTSPSATSRLRREVLNSARKLNDFRPRHWGKAKLAGEAVRGRQLIWAFEAGGSDKVQAKLLKDIAAEVGRRYPDVQLRYAWLQ